MKLIETTTVYIGTEPFEYSVWEVSENYYVGRSNFDARFSCDGKSIKQVYDRLNNIIFQLTRSNENEI